MKYKILVAALGIISGAAVFTGCATSGGIDTQIDVAMAQHYEKEYSYSAATFNRTDILMEQARTKSISQAAGATVLNENITEYNGNIYEYLLINAFNSLNYYNLGNLEEALVEIRKIENKQKLYVNLYGDLVLSKDEEDYSALENAGSYMSLDMGQIYESFPREPKESDIYRDSAFAHYLAALMYLQYGGGSPELHSKQYKALWSQSNQASLDDDLSIPKGYGRLDFIALGGRIICRHEKELYFPDYDGDGIGDFIPSLRIDGVTIPAFRLKYVYPAIFEDAEGHVAFPGTRISKIHVVLSDGRETNLELVENLDLAVQKDVASKAKKAFVRSLFRSTLKKASAVSAAAVGISSTPADFRFLAELAAIASLEAVDLAETADVRQAKNFPSVIYGGGFTLESGLYSGKIEYFDKNGKCLYCEYFKDIQVKEGIPVIVESVCLD